MTNDGRALLGDDALEKGTLGEGMVYEIWAAVTGR
jgi:hypothetical protein